MKKLFVAMCSVLLMLGVGTSRSFAQTELLDMQVNVNGAVTDISALYTIPGMNSSAFDTANPSTGLGTLAYTYNPGAGTYFFDVFIDAAVAQPFYNEYGTAVGGPAPAGESWEIGDSFLSPIFNDVTVTGGTLSDTNYLPFVSGGDNYSGNCPAGRNGSGCNGDAAVALGEGFTLGTNQYEVITITSSTTAPSSGFYIDQTHPIDAGNAVASDMYFSISAATDASCQGNACNVSPVPEPSPWILLATGLLGAGMIQLRRKYSFEGGR